MIRKMNKEHAKLMVFPELCITGYTCQDLFEQRRLLDSAWDTLLWIAKESREADALIFVGLPVRFGGKLYNAAAAVNKGKILGSCQRPICPITENFMNSGTLSAAGRSFPI